MAKVELWSHVKKFYHTSLADTWKWWAALVFLSLAFLLAKRYLSLPLPRVNLLLQWVHRRLNDELEIARLQVAELQSKFEQAQRQGRTLGFQELNFNSKYPAFVFRNNQLLLWTQHRFWLNREYLNGKFDVQAMSHSGGTFIIYKQSIRQGHGERVHFAVLIPLEVRYKTKWQWLKPGVNPDIFPDEKIVISRNPEEGFPIKSRDGRYLFSLLLPGNYHFSGGFSEENTILLLLLASLVIASWQTYERMQHYLATRRYTDGLILLATFLIGVRLAILILDEPAAFNRWTLFSAVSFASSVISRSLGDLFINIFFVFLICSYCYLHYPRLIDKQHLQWLKQHRQAVGIGLVITAYLFFFFHFSLLRNLYLNSQISLDIAQQLSFDVLRFTSLSIFLLSSFIFFFVSHIALRLATAVFTEHYQLLSTIAGVGISAIVVLEIFSIQIPWHIALLCSVYLAVASKKDWLKKARSFNYLSYLYLNLGVAVTAIMGALATYQFEQQAIMEKKRKIAFQLADGNDKLGEFLLYQMLQKIRTDQTIINRMLTPYSGKDIIIQKIKKQHLDKYFDNYEVNVLLFDGNGEPYNYHTPYDSLMNNFQPEKYKTEYPHILYINRLNGEIPAYVCFTDLLRNGTRIGRIIIELRRKYTAPFGAYPNFQLTAELVPEAIEQGISYALIVNGALTHSSSNFNYTPALLTALGAFSTQQSKQAIVKTINNFQHLLISPREGVQVVVSSPVYPLQNIISNFSFLFLALLVGKLLLLGFYGLRLGARQLLHMPISLSAKIQIYLNIAFFLPLVVVSIITTGLLNNQSRREIQEAYIEKAVAISNNAGIATYMEAYEKGQVSKDRLEENIVRIAQLANAYINLYSASGRLLASNEFFSYQSGLATDLINPQALAELSLNPQGRTILSETIGNLQYSSVYVAVRSAVSGKIAGIIGIPFFESQRSSEKRIISLLTSIMNVFTFVFIGMAALSYFASRILTEPLRLITRTIGHTSLTQLNQPLSYPANDEIGLLVDAYNRMLKQLQESKEALSRSEKESAWREMARQVAHEIKNPLTPMKLTLQHLQRTFASDNPRIGRALESLLHQVDTLSDIATSFASFANMPIPKNEEFEMGELLRQTCLLHQSEETAQIELQMPAGKFFVKGDRQLMGQIITNLIINGIQAVPHNRKPEIRLALSYRSNDRLIISVADNGVGIPEDIASKVFLPNFSTKFSGSGIGLALAKRGVEHAGGRIWFETKVSVGTTFFIELPLLKVITEDTNQSLINNLPEMTTKQP